MRSATRSATGSGVGQRVGAGGGEGPLERQPGGTRVRAAGEQRDADGEDAVEQLAAVGAARAGRAGVARQGGRGGLVAGRQIDEGGELRVVGGQGGVDEAGGFVTVGAVGGGHDGDHGGPFGVGVDADGLEAGAAGQQAADGGAGAAVTALAPGWIGGLEPCFDRGEGRGVRRQGARAAGPAGVRRGRRGPLRAAGWRR